MRRFLPLRGRAARSLQPRHPCGVSESCSTSMPICRWTLRMPRSSPWPTSSIARPCSRRTVQISRSTESMAGSPFGSCLRIPQCAHREREGNRSDRAERDVRPDPEEGAAESTAIRPPTSPLPLHVRTGKPDASSDPGRMMTSPNRRSGIASAPYRQTNRISSPPQVRSIITGSMPRAISSAQCSENSRIKSSDSDRECALLCHQLAFCFFVCAPSASNRRMSPGWHATRRRSHRASRIGSRAPCGF